jgi:hypothetical protein
MILTTPFPNRYGPGGQFVRVVQGYAPMGMWAAKRYSKSHEHGNPGFSLTTGLRGIYGQGTGIDGLYDGMGDLSGDGSGLFGTGLFGSNWGLPEFAIIGIVGYFLVAGFGGSAQARRKEMQKARLDYEARVAAIRDKYPRLPHPKSLF